MKVLIAKLTSELGRYYEYYDSLDALIMPPGTEVLTFHQSSPAKSRNMIIKQALKEDKYTHIFFTDDDHVYPKDTLMRLLSDNVDIVSGYYCMKFPPFPIIALNNPNDENMSAFVNVNEQPHDQIYTVARVPAGCLLVTTSALKTIQQYLEPTRMKNLWFTLGQIKPDEWGDDLWFCDRARNAGLDIFIDPCAPIGHITKCILYPKYDEELKRWRIDFQINAGYQIGETKLDD